MSRDEPATVNVRGWGRQADAWMSASAIWQQAGSESRQNLRRGVSAAPGLESMPGALALGINDLSYPDLRPFPFPRSFVPGRFSLLDISSARRIANSR